MTTTTISSSTQVLADLFPRRDSRSRAITQDAVLVVGFALLTALAAQIEIPLGFIVFLMVKNPGITSAKKAAKILKISTFFGLIAIYTGSTL